MTTSDRNKCGRCRCSRVSVITIRATMPAGAPIRGRNARATIDLVPATWANRAHRVPRTVGNIQHCGASKQVCTAFDKPPINSPSHHSWCVFLAETRELVLETVLASERKEWKWKICIRRPPTALPEVKMRNWVSEGSSAILWQIVLGVREELLVINPLQSGGIRRMWYMPVHYTSGALLQVGKELFSSRKGALWVFIVSCTPSPSYTMIKIGKSGWGGRQRAYELRSSVAPMINVQIKFYFTLLLWIESVLIKYTPVRPNLVLLLIINETKWKCAGKFLGTENAFYKSGIFTIRYFNEILFSCNKCQYVEL